MKTTSDKKIRELIAATGAVGLTADAMYAVIDDVIDDEKSDAHDVGYDEGYRNGEYNERITTHERY